MPRQGSNRLDIYVHGHDDTIDAKLDRLISQGEHIMAKVDELKAELVDINTSTNEIAADIDNLLGRLTGGLSDAEANEVKDQLTALKTQLQGIAAKHTA